MCCASGASLPQCFLASTLALISVSYYRFAGLVFLEGFQLTALDLSAGYFSDAHMMSLRSMPLTSLILRGCSALTAGCLEHLRGLPLKKLNVHGCPDLTPAALAGAKSSGALPAEVVVSRHFDEI